MAIRENIVASAKAHILTFYVVLQDPNVAGSPIENRIAFLQSKNLTKEEVDTALSRSNCGVSLSSVAHLQNPQHTVQQIPTSGGHQQFLWQPPPPNRDWRDWFIMATVLSGLGYGMYNMVKRYVYPMIAPPTTPQLEQDKNDIEGNFQKVFTLVEQLAKDTDELKASEQARTTKLDVTLSEIEGTIGNIKSMSRVREEEGRHIMEEVRGLRQLVPKAMEEHKSTTSLQLKELNDELKSLKLLLSQRLNPSIPSISSSFRRGSASEAASPGLQARNNITDTLPTEPGNKSSLPSNDEPTPGSNTTPPVQGVDIFSKGKAAIPSWQMAAKRTVSHEKLTDNEEQEQKIPPVE
ncbi:Peroxisomal membrane protein PER10 [Golovinomyces cichoracearum]|uniref:Peroxisomal membrane protein PEX14 n=1 Tax=Golovinomyces cichoracearum TaxID=62708 RepID=A0A420HM32_9PEZI|nr:Peroxisomal membrane protein PER10 [Golovinomyces cichoracearum]